MFDHFCDAAGAGRDGDDLTRHRLQCRQAERFQLTRHQQEVCDSQFLLHLVLLAQEEHILMNSFCTASHSATERSGPSPISSSFEGICLRTRSKISITSERRFTGRKFERCTSNFSPLAAYSERSSSGFLFLTYTSQLTEL